jgi:hypothetical protein
MPKSNKIITRLNNKLHNLQEEDFYKDAKGGVIFTEIYHKKRGYCCKKTCKHCPWNHQTVL